MPFARTFPLDPNYCLPRSSTHALTVIERVLQCPGGAENNKESLASGRGPSRKQGLPRAKGPEPTGAWSALADETSRCPGTAATREDGGRTRPQRGERPLGSKTQPLSPSPLFADLPLTLDIPANPGQHPAPPRPGICSRTPASTSSSSSGSVSLPSGFAQSCRETRPRMPSGRPRTAPSQRPLRRSLEIGTLRRGPESSRPRGAEF